MDVLMEMYEEEMKNPIQGMLFGMCLIILRYVLTFII